MANTSSKSSSKIASILDNKPTKKDKDISTDLLISAVISSQNFALAIDKLINSEGLSGFIFVANISPMKRFNSTIPNETNACFMDDISLWRINNDELT